MEEFAFFLPTRSGSERVKNKNTKPFAGIKGGLLELKISQLLELPFDYPIYVSTNDSATIEIVKKIQDSRVKLVIRPNELCLSTTKLEDLIEYVPSLIQENHIVWIHVTEPFVDEKCLEESIHIYTEQVINNQNYDCLMSCNKIQTFLWDKEINDFISHNQIEQKWPRSQDLKPIFEINSAIFINSRLNYLKYKNRIGKKPYLFELNKIQSIDIDWEEDFKFAELVYESTRKV